MASYTKADLLAHVSERAGVSKADAEKVIESLFATVIGKSKEGEKVAWPGFGAFSAAKRAARTGRNPRTGEEIAIPASTAIKFTPAKALKDALNS